MTSHTAIDRHVSWGSGVARGEGAASPPVSWRAGPRNGKNEIPTSDRSQAHQIGGNGSGRERGDPWVGLATADPLGRDLEPAPDPVGSKRQVNLATQLVG